MKRWRPLPVLGWGLISLLLGACGAVNKSAALPVALPPAPEIATGRQTKPGWRFERQAVVAAHPLAAEAGRRILNQGGTATDAAVAAALVLAVVEPQSSGIGGGGFLLHFDGRRSVQAFDGRETAPAGATEGLFLLPNGQPRPFAQGVVSGLSVGVPGMVRMLELAHRQHGRLAWATVVAPAIVLAADGFPISPRLNQSLQADRHLRLQPAAAAFFYQADGRALPVGHQLRNPALAAVLRRLAAEGSRALHEGPVAQDISQRVQSHERPGTLTPADLAGYQALTREPLCHDWQRWRICGMPPPSSGAVVMGQVLGLLAQRAPQPMLEGGQASAEWLHSYIEAARLAQADRDQYIADPAFVSPPAGSWHSLLDAGYLSERAQLMGPRAAAQVSAGQPASTLKAHAPQAESMEAGTTHLSVVDAAGCAVALTASIEASFGARILADGGTGLSGGFLLNNQLTDFAWQPRNAQGMAVANRAEAGKRPRSSMNPVLVFDRNSGQLVMSLGSPGGLAIPHYIAKALLGGVEAGLSPQAAVDLPNFAQFGSTAVLETGRFKPETLAALRERGHRVQEAELTSGIHTLQRQGSLWLAGADPRREGVAAGD